MIKKGFLLVASVNKSYLVSAQVLADSIKEYYPDSHITLFTEDRWVNDNGNWIFDSIVGGAPTHERAKLWALSQTPYEITAYYDVDTICEHSDIRCVFDGLGDKDIVFTKIRPYAAANTWWDEDKTDAMHGGFFVYNNKPHTIEFMKKWWERYLIQRTYKNESDWPWKKYYRDDVQYWDQFTIWLMLRDQESAGDWYEPDVKWGWINNGKHDSRWNWMASAYRHNELPEDVPIVVKSIGSPKFYLFHKYF